MLLCNLCTHMIFSPYLFYSPERERESCVTIKYTFHYITYKVFFLPTCSLAILYRITFHFKSSLHLCGKTAIRHLFKMQLYLTNQFWHFLFKRILSGKIKEQFTANNYAQPSAGVKAFLHITRDNDFLFLLGIFSFYKKKIKLDYKHFVVRYD